ncbi:ATP-grasp domain-containing protein [Agromyces intestinalis]|uniref:biotin carboxylase n=1 Tax=Agromyces intestinalis TaxID=2592652 RepID=A0A5C1YEW7_9MICO|nr:biotin carboxylase N-terminal domain-containing protein [Agromyces intestinalis]QEO13322.1 ATP-grasp domain-containing protein [Agromyces intestinalis]
MGQFEPTARPFERVLVANRGEIAVRVIRTLRRLGIHAVAVYSDADRDAPHVALADSAVRIGPAPALESYLDPTRIVEAALATGAQAVHPGYGFLSEHAGFARACADAGIVFVGPGVEALEIMGDKVRAKAHVAASGVPIVPGVSDLDLPDPGDRHRDRDRDERLVEAAARIGYPVLVKPSAGGGGKGMQVARDAGELRSAVPAARRIAAAAFGDDTLLVERLIERPRHIEVQVLGDAHGAVVHLGERECSLQRRHQKVVEEAPSPLLDEATRERIGRAACDAARSVDYRGAGTVEFLVSDAAPGEFFFIEMNTRLQVEHPVTELVTGVDLVEQQLRVAAGEPLSFAQHDVPLDGHAIEARVYAESPERGFLPATGEVLAWREPTGDGVRVDAGIRTGSTVTADYDPMLAKVIAHGATRSEALRRLDGALADTVLLGVESNTGFLRRLLADPDVRAGALHTGLIDALVARLAGGADGASTDASGASLLQAAAEALLERDAEDARGRIDGPAAWRRERGWRVGGRVPTAYLVEPVAGIDGEGPLRIVAPERLADAASGLEASRVASEAEAAGASAAVTAIAPDGTVWVHVAGRTAAVRRVDRATALAARRARLGRSGAHDPELRAPMPGTVTAVLVADGDTVHAGQAVVAVEAMKMEHRITAPVDGVARVAVAVGDRVVRDHPVARIEAHADHGARSEASASEPAHEAAIRK